jgi:hypothetical protein
MKVAFTFSGALRDLETTYPHFKLLIDKYDADVFISTWDLENIEKGDTVENFKSKYNPLICEVENWEAWKEQYWNTISLNFRVPSTPNHRLNPKEESKAASPVRFAQWYKIQKANYLTKLVDKEYDIVVKLRTDIILKDDFFIFNTNSLNFPQGFVYINGWKDCKGPHDYIFYGPPHLMDYTTNLFYFISKYHSEGHYIHPPENLLGHHLAQRDIPLRFYNFKVELRGKIATHPLQNQPFNYYIAYSSKMWDDKSPNPNIKFYKK